MGTFSSGSRIRQLLHDHLWPVQHMQRDHIVRGPLKAASLGFWCLRHNTGMSGRRFLIGAGLAPRRSPSKQ